MAQKSEEAKEKQPIEHESASQAEKKNRKKATLIKTATIGVLVVFLILVGYFLIIQEGIFDETEEVPVTTVDRLDDAFGHEMDGDIQAALAAYRELIDEQDDDSVRAVYYAEKARIAQRAEDNQLARSFVRQSLELDETSNGLQLKAVLLESDGELKQALEYYERALSLLQQQEEFEREHKDFIEEQVNRLSEAVN